MKRHLGATTVDAVVLGAGISGLVSASVLLGQGSRTVVVLDEYGHVGGNHIDVAVGGFTYDVGSLVFQDDSPLLAHFPEILPRYVPVVPTWARLNPQGKITHYPFSIRDDVIAAGPVECLRMALSAVGSRVSRRELRNAQDFTDHLLGPRFVHRSGLGHYMERFCGLPPAQIELEFAQNRLEWLAGQARVGALVRRVIRSRTGDPEPPGSNTQLVRPREGFTHLYQPAVDTLSRRGVEFKLGATLRAVREVDGHFEVGTAEGVVRARRVVSTIPLERALELCEVEVPGRPLPTVTLISLFFSFLGERGFEPPILYNFSREGAWKRVTVHSDFYGRSRGREYFTAEVIGKRVGVSVEAAVRDFRVHCAANGLLEGDLALEASNVLGNAYPIYTQGSGQRARDAVQALRAFGLESLGRQGAFQYQPTARASTLEAEQALDRPPPARGTRSG